MRDNSSQYTKRTESFIHIGDNEESEPRIEILEPASPEHLGLMSPKFTDTVKTFFTEIKKNLGSVLNTPDSEMYSKFAHSCPTEREGTHTKSNNHETCFEESDDCFSKQDFESSNGYTSVCEDSQLGDCEMMYQAAPSFAGIES